MYKKYINLSFICCHAKEEKCPKFTDALGLLRKLENLLILKPCVVKFKSIQRF